MKKTTSRHRKQQAPAVTENSRHLGYKRLNLFPKHRLFPVIRILLFRAVCLQSITEHYDFKAPFKVTGIESTCKAAGTSLLLDPWVLTSGCSVHHVSRNISVPKRFSKSLSTDLGHTPQSGVTEPRVWGKQKQWDLLLPQSRRHGPNSGLQTYPCPQTLNP